MATDRRIRLVAALGLVVGALDAWSTWAALHEPRTYEANPSAAWVHAELGLVPGLAVAAVASPLAFLLVAAAFRRLPDPWRAPAELGLVVGGVLWLVVARLVVVAGNVALLV